MASQLAVVSFSAMSHGICFGGNTMEAVLQELVSALDGTENVTKIFLHAGDEFVNLAAAVRNLVAARPGCRMEEQAGKTIITLANGRVVSFVVVGHVMPPEPVPVQDVEVPAAPADDDSHTTLGDDDEELAEIRQLANPPSRPRHPRRRTNRDRRRPTRNQNLEGSDESDTPLLYVSGWGLTQEM
ncbi:hypothetical protein SEMRO_58_G033650.1 [Seminavis robusta]|uniref:Uncharacterized protein n=1 Tax=Seminavis robusta TaxID=568900 RepID=A0A9N8DCC9_9STRA|nr:hypothetical protein SEMRO_58_G033650.1 [Seminavis robusta]|eukprot:Sro58_g033650.1 n/a (185) ;mRNA; f:37177-37731